MFVLLKPVETFVAKLKLNTKTSLQLFKISIVPLCCGAVTQLSFKNPVPHSCAIKNVYQHNFSE